MMARDPAVVKAYLGEEMILLEVRNLDAFYGAVQVLHDVNLFVGAGEIVGLVGANAAGKSSLMFTLAGLRTTHQGEVCSKALPSTGYRPMSGPQKAWCWCRSGGGYSLS